MGDGRSASIGPAIACAAALFGLNGCAGGADTARLATLPQPAEAGVAQLPLFVVPSDRPGDTFAVFYSGDNGWATQVRGVADRLSTDAVPVVGVSAVRYFIHRKTPDQAAADLARIIDRFGHAWGRPRVILVGYSFGADALPLIAMHLPAATRAQVRLMALISPSDHGDLAFRGVSWFDWRWPGDQPLQPAIGALAGTPMICIHAAHDPRAACNRFSTGTIRPIELAGGHRYEGRLDTLADVIAGSADLPPSRP